MELNKDFAGYKKLGLSMENADQTGTRSIFFEKSQ